MSAANGKRRYQARKAYRAARLEAVRRAAVLRGRLMECGGTFRRLRAVRP